MTQFTNIDWDRTEKYTDEEFANIPRNSDGDITVDFAVHLIWMTEVQKERLSDYDDHRRYLEEEELAYMMAEAKAEFSGA